MGKPGEAVKVLISAHEQHPNDLELMYALSTIERDRGDAVQALWWVEKMLTVNPADQTAMQLKQMLKGSE